MIALSPILSIIAGLILLFSGRRVFWLAAALVAFLFVYRLMQNFFGPGLIGIIIAAVIGLIFVWLALNFIRVLGFVVGALAGAVAAPILLGMFGIHWAGWVMALVGAVVGIIVIGLAFDWGVILMTAWLGANLIVENALPMLGLGAAIAGIAFVVLLVIGILAQAGQLAGRGRPRPQRE